MLWKVDGKEMISPSSYDDEIEDVDNESYTSVVDATLVDNPIAIGMLKLNMGWDYLTEEEAENLMQVTYKNPMMVTVKVPSVPGGILRNAKFRISKRKTKMHKTGKDEDASKSYWQVSFNMMQKELTEQQKEAVKNAQNQ